MGWTRVWAGLVGFVLSVASLQPRFEPEKENDVGAAGHAAEKFNIAPASQPLKPQVAILVDTRQTPQLPMVVQNIHSVTGWPIQVFHGPGNAQFVKSKLSEVVPPDKLSFVNIGVDKLAWAEYSGLMTMPKFWQAVEGEVVLTFQPDTVMCAAATKKLSDFLNFDYVGAPLLLAKSGMVVGNGGLSLRKRATQLAIAEQCARADGPPEDQQMGMSSMQTVQLCKAHNIAPLIKPGLEDAAHFAVEWELPADGAVPLGCHKCWHRYHKFGDKQDKTWLFMRDKCPEAKRLYEGFYITPGGAKQQSFSQPSPSAEQLMAYSLRYPDLQRELKGDLALLRKHWEQHGRGEGRVMFPSPDDHSTNLRAQLNLTRG